jgi:WD40 repeat protein
LHYYTNAISALTFSPNGKWLAMRREDGAVSLWDTAARQPVTELVASGRFGGYKALAFSPRGDLLAWGSEPAVGQHGLSLWDLNACMEVACLVHSAGVVSAAFSPDAHVIATLARDGMVRVWEVASRQVLASFQTESMDHSPNGLSVGWAVSASMEQDLASVSPESASEPSLRLSNIRLRATGHFGDVAFTPDGRWLAVSGLGTRVRLWDWADDRENTPLELPADGDNVTSLAISRDGRWLAAAAGFDHSTLHVWDLGTRSKLRLAGHKGSVFNLAFSPDARMLASVGGDQVLRLWDLAGKDKPRQLRGNTDDVWAVAWSPDGRDLVTGASDGTVRFWDPTGWNRCLVGPCYPATSGLLRLRRSHRHEGRRIARREVVCDGRHRRQNHALGCANPSPLGCRSPIQRRVAHPGVFTG